MLLRQKFIFFFIPSSSSSFRWPLSVKLHSIIIIIEFNKNHLFNSRIVWISNKFNFYYHVFTNALRFSGYFGPDNNGTYSRAESSVLTVEKLSGPLYSVTEMHSNRAALELSSEVTEVIHKDSYPRAVLYYE